MSPFPGFAWSPERLTVAKPCARGALKPGVEEFTELRSPTAQELQGRASGSALWRRSRGEATELRAEEEPTAVERHGRCCLELHAPVALEGPDPFAGGRLMAEALLWLEPDTLRPEAHMNPVLSRHGPAAGWELRATQQGAQLLVTLDQRHVELSVPGPSTPGWRLLRGSYDGEVLRVALDGEQRELSVQGDVTPYDGPWHA